MTSTDAAAAKFGKDRAGEYAVQSRIALAGYDACHELAACLLAAQIGRDRPARLLVLGAGGTGQEMLTAGKLAPSWSFTAVDPSPPMLGLARGNVDAAGLGTRVSFHESSLEELPDFGLFDGATLIGVLHHLPGSDAKAEILQMIAARLQPGAPFVLACNRSAYRDRPLFLSAWAERWRQNGAGDEEVEAKLGTILRGADPPDSDAAVEAMLAQAGFSNPLLFFSSLFWEPGSRRGGPTGKWRAWLDIDPASKTTPSEATRIPPSLMERTMA